MSKKNPETSNNDNTLGHESVSDNAAEKNETLSVFDKVSAVLLEHLEEEGLYNPETGKIEASKGEIAQIFGEISAGGAINGLETLDVVNPDKDSKFTSMVAMGEVLKTFTENDGVINKESRKEIGKHVDPDTSAKSEADYYEATHDDYTDLLNRKGVQDMLAAKDEEGSLLYKPLAYFFIDARKFKRVNTLYGELGGDMGVKIIAQALQNVARANDLVGRRGGDEFCMIIRESRKSAQKVGKMLGDEDLQHIAGRMEDELEKLLQELQVNDIDDLSLTVDKVDEHTGGKSRVTIDPSTIKLDIGVSQWMGGSEDYSTSRLVAEKRMKDAKDLNKRLAA
ncbi:MAG: GGDEF domain-containing protein [Candidatus Saccharibacteria bacterium]|nr:GGDEF domain-containing protein [Candidatus Saccharibacteria bacterium]